MAERLAVYEIDDFGDNSANDGFYISNLSEHFQKHPFISKPHRHQFYIIVHFTAGNGTHTIDFVNYTVSPGSIFFLLPAQVHSWSLSPDTEGRILFFSKEFIEDYFTKKTNSYPLFYSRYQLLQIKDLNTEKQVSNLMDNLETNKNDMDIVRDYLDILILKLGRIFPSTESKTDPGIGNIQKLEVLIEHHFITHQPPSFYADELHFSVKHLNDLCKKYLNKTTSQLIHKRIILEAKRLLTHDSLSIKEIANDLNFEDHAYFTRLFKKMTGKTPGEFRIEVKTK